MKRTERSHAEARSRTPDAALPRGPRQDRSPTEAEGEIARLAARVEELERERRDHERLRADLKRQHRALKSDRAQLSEHLAMASHEILTPLVIAEAYITQIHDDARHELDIYARRDLDGLARVFAGVRPLVEALLLDARDSQRPLRRELTDLDAVVQDCIATLAPEISERRARVEVDPLPTVRANAALLSGVFANLLANALKYGPRQGPEIRVSVQSDAHWVFAVRSAGAAIPEAERGAIFEPWRRGRTAGSEGGSGLGLAIVRRIVERHGGEVWVTSPSSSSNCFFFSLPV
jgi:signal transduction histidine kinase